CGLILWGIISLHFPGRKYHGPPTPNGYRPEYWNSGFKFYVISMLIAIPVLWNYSVLHLYYKIPNLIAILIAFGVIFCFYYSEDSYLHTIDASHDRFGYYLAWGCIAFVPAFYSLNSLYLVKHSPID
ncbi:unnamed protein product, partial [Oppiella nova]